MKILRQTNWLILILASGLFSCVEKEKVTLDGNTPLNPHTVPTVKIENYVNRIFIDLLGRVPTELEMDAEVSLLKEGNLSREARETLIDKLQNDTTYHEGDSSYRHAYYQRIYDLAKSRMCEGAEDGEFTRLAGIARFSLTIARLEGDSAAVYRALEIIDRNEGVVKAKYLLRNKEIDISELFARMLDNGVYDVINMNSFNFVNASFDDLFFRFPTQDEFRRAYEIIEHNKPAALFGGYATNKKEYCDLLTRSRQFYEGLIVWNYLLIMGRNPTSAEMSFHFPKLYATSDMANFQKQLLVTDEYANF